MAACLKGLTFVIHRLVIIPDSEAVALQVNRGYNNYPPWPGSKQTIPSINGHALVGCPNGYGVKFSFSSSALNLSITNSLSGRVHACTA